MQALSEDRRRGVTPERRLSRRLVVIAALTVVAASVMAFSASSAKADFTWPFKHKCTGISITGAGTGVQDELHDAVSAYWRQHSSSTKTRGCGPNARQRVDYAPIASPFGGLGASDVSYDRWVTNRFIGLDRAPSVPERSAIESAASKHGAAKLWVVPVAQSAMTLITRFPRHCELRAGDPNLAAYARFKLDNARLSAALHGDQALDKWGELLPGIRAVPGNAAGRNDQYCRDRPVSRVFPDVDTPHTQHAKHFLHQIAPWLGWLHHAIHGSWPNPGSVTGGGTTNVAVAKKVAQIDGAIAIVDLGAARAAGFSKRDGSSTPGAYTYSGANQFTGYPAFGRSYSFADSTFWLPLEVANSSAYTGTGVFAEPTIDRVAIRTGRRGSNCRYVQYYNEPRTPGGRYDPYGDWSQTTALFAHGHYPGCVASYIAFWDDPADVFGGGLLEQGRARTAKDYLTFLSYYGQNLLFRKDYAPVPHSNQKQLDMRFAPRRAATLIGWKKP